MSLTVYKNITVVDSVLLPASQLESNIYDCTITKNHGSYSLRIITFPTGWTTCDVGFKIYRTQTDVNGTTLFLSDGTDQSPYTITGSLAGTSVALIPGVFDSLQLFSIVVSAPQSVDTNVLLTLSPIYQGVA